MKENHHASPAENARYIERLIQGFSAANREAFTRWIRRMEAKGASVNYRKILANALGKLDLGLHGSSASNATPDQLTNVILEWRSKRNPTTVNGYVSAWRMFYKHLHGQIPLHLDAALTKRQVRAGKQRQVVSHDECARRLRAAVDLPGGRALLTAALIVTLRATGMRAGEICALTVGSWRPNEDGSAYLVLPHDARGLKTGPRTVVVTAEYRPTIDLWMEHTHAHWTREPQCSRPTRRARVATGRAT